MDDKNKHITNYIFDELNDLEVPEEVNFSMLQKKIFWHNFFRFSIYSFNIYYVTVGLLIGSGSIYIGSSSHSKDNIPAIEMSDSSEIREVADTFIVDIGEENILQDTSKKIIIKEESNISSSKNIKPAIKDTLLQEKDTVSVNANLNIVVDIEKTQLLKDTVKVTVEDTVIRKVKIIKKDTIYRKVSK